jgi:hypothetical protein
MEDQASPAHASAKVSDMDKVPFSKQVLPGWNNPFAAAELTLTLGGILSKHQLARLIEVCGDKPLPVRLRGHLVKLLRGEVKPPRGRKRTSEAWLEFSLYDADQCYNELLTQFKTDLQREKANAKASGTRSPRACDTASERAYKQVLTEMKHHFPNVDWRTLRNLHSKWRRGKLARLHEEPSDGDEYIDSV